MSTPAEKLTDLLRRAGEQQRPVVLLGVGNPLRGDDAVAHELAISLAGMNSARFHAHAIGTAIENATHWVRQASGGLLLIVDAVFDESLPEGAWAFLPPDRLDTLCHTTHSIPLSLLISLWQREISGLEIHFVGISIRNNSELAPLSQTQQNTLDELHALIAENIGSRAFTSQGKRGWQASG